MSNFDNTSEKWYSTTTITAQTGSFTIPTKNKFVNRNIELNFNIPGMVIPKPDTGTNEFYITVPNGSSGTITFNFSVDANGNTTIT